MKKLLYCAAIAVFLGTATFTQKANAVVVNNIESELLHEGHDKKGKAACCKGKSAKECAKGKDGKACKGKEEATTTSSASAKPACCAAKAAGKSGCSSASAEKKDADTPTK